ncbi:MFS transporter [Thorsellia kenyensis]|uniref:MFS transporter n=1 Tax=Thorsellia kenyensis TaxID=1549888 RepID=A0ABV6CB06_9GAMM
MNSTQASQPLNYGMALLTAIVLFAAIAPGILMTAPAVASQVASEWGLSESQIGDLFFVELGAMSLATLPAYLWLSRVNWHVAGYIAAALFIAGNIASAFIQEFHLILIVRFLASLGGGSLMILSITCAANAPNPSRVYSWWLLGQLAFGTIGLLIFPPLFEKFGIKAIYFSLAATMAIAIPLIKSFPIKPFNVTVQTVKEVSHVSLFKKILAILGVLSFYICISSVWTFIGNIGVEAGLNSKDIGVILSISTGAGIVGAIVAGLLSINKARQLMLLIGYGLLLGAILLLLGAPDTLRFIIAAVAFKFTWSFVCPFMLAQIADLDTSGKLMNSSNLVIGGGLAIGPMISGRILQNMGMNSLLIWSLVCSVISLYLIIIIAKKSKIYTLNEAYS